LITYEFIRVSVFAEIENEELVSQSASSEDVKKIDRQIIEGVRFQFVTKPLFSRTKPDSENPFCVTAVFFCIPIRRSRTI